MEAKRETVIRAPMAGVVTNIAVNRGQSIAADAPLATVLPERQRPARGAAGAHARHRLRAAKGQEVVLRYEAFPYERFGQYRGVVTDIGRNVWTPGERVGPLSAKEPVYRVDVKLEQADR